MEHSILASLLDAVIFLNKTLTTANTTQLIATKQPTNQQWQISLVEYVIKMVMIIIIGLVLKNKLLNGARLIQLACEIIHI